jgi:ribosome-binding factor A
VSKKNERPPEGTHDEHHEDDGVDPRRYLDRRQPPSMEHKLARMLGEVERVLTFEIGYLDEFDDPIEIVSITPDPDPARLLVRFRGGGPDAVARLEAHRGHLRSEIARALNRRKTPDLAFVRDETP